jgi:transposase-like protein
MTVHDNAPRPPCPYCGSRTILKNGSTHHKKQKFLCQDCRRQFIENPQKKIISEEQKNTAKDLLLERISLAGIARALKVSKTWRQGLKFFNHEGALWYVIHYDNAIIEAT